MAKIVKRTFSLTEEEAHPERLIPIDEAFHRIEAKLQARIKAAE